MSEESKNEHEIMLTTYDRLLRSWENSMENVRNFEMHAKRIEDQQVKDVFKKFAEEEGIHASKFRDILLEMKHENRYEIEHERKDVNRHEKI
jgi:rubrerythrin